MFMLFMLSFGEMKIYIQFFDCVEVDAPNSPRYFYFPENLSTRTFHWTEELHAKQPPLPLGL